MDVLMAEVIEGHIRYYVLAQNESAIDEQTRAADDLVSALRAYLKWKAALDCNSGTRE
jgi:hypothetical protein